MEDREEEMSASSMDEHDHEHCSSEEEEEIHDDDEEDYHEMEEDEFGDDGEDDEDDEDDEDSDVLDGASLIDYAISLKEEGNALYNEKDYGEAVLKYKEALLSLDYLNSSVMEDHYDSYVELKIMCVLNVSACHVKLMEYNDALSNAMLALDLIDREIRKNQVHEQLQNELKTLKMKGLFRKGQSIRLMGNLTEAKTIFEEAMTFDPDNKAIQCEMRKICEGLKGECQESKAKKRKLTCNATVCEKMRQKEAEQKRLCEEKRNAVKKELLSSGFFGGIPESGNVYNMLSRREYSGLFKTRAQINASYRFLPEPSATREPKRIDHYSKRAYSGQYSDDGNLFYTTCQDWNVRIYDTQGKDFSLKKTVTATYAQWTLTDACLSNDSSYLIYSSITPFVHLYKIDFDSTDKETEAKQELLDFSASDQALNYGFGIWSLRFSADKTEIIAGSSDDSLYLYNVERKSVQKFAGHKDEVNAVAFAETDNSNVLYTGSDDRLIYVWDRRSLGSRKGKAEGMLVGHTEGITYLSSKGDGRYLVSNGKDQTMKLWDIRKTMTCTEYGNCAKPKKRYQWDYRGMDYPGNPTADMHPSDRSIVTFLGHRVLRTLVRCHFSPARTTGQRYVYTGSQDGTVRIYDLSGQCVRSLDNTYGSVVRDVSWSPREPTLVATSWDGTLYQFTHDE